MKLPSILASLLLSLGFALCASALGADLSESVILVAKRDLHDRIYGSTIIVAKPLGAERHIGFIVNKPTSLTLGKLFPNHGPSQKIVDPVYLGGPMGPEVIFALVKGQSSPGGHSLRIAPGLFLAYDSQVVDRIIETQAQQARFFAGMVLWQPNELHEEVNRGVWYVLDLPPDLLLRKPTDGMWEDFVMRAERRANTI